MKYYFYKRSIIIGSIAGLIGGLIEIWLSKDDFGLGYFSGYLFFINYISIIAIGLAIKTRLEKEKSTYLKRLGFGFFIYSVITTIRFLNMIMFYDWAGRENTTLEDFVALIVLALIGLTISSLLALIIRPRNK